MAAFRGTRNDDADTHRSFKSALAQGIFGGSGDGKNNDSDGLSSDGGGGGGGRGDGMGGSNRKRDYYEMSQIERLEAGITEPPIHAPESDGAEDSEPDGSDDGASTAWKIRAARRAKDSTANRRRFSVLSNSTGGSSYSHARPRHRPHKRIRRASGASSLPTSAAAAAAAGGSPMPPMPPPPPLPPPPPPPPPQQFDGAWAGRIPLEEGVDSLDTNDINEAENSARDAADRYAAAANDSKRQSFRDSLNDLVREGGLASGAGGGGTAAASAVPPAPSGHMDHKHAARAPPRELSAEERALYELNNPAPGTNSAAAAAAAAANALSTDALNSNMSLTFANGGEDRPEFVPFDESARVYDSADPVVRKAQQEEDKHCPFCLFEQYGITSGRDTEAMRFVTSEFIKNRRKPLEVLGPHLQTIYWTKMGKFIKKPWSAGSILRHFFIHAPPQETILPESVQTLSQLMISLKRKGLWVKDERGGMPLVHSANTKLYLTLLKEMRSINARG